MSEKIHMALIYVLATPLIIAAYCQHLFEGTLSLNHKLRDKLFMKRCNFIDDKHFDDFMEWTIDYTFKRAKK